jgi:translation initiation factor IF-3
MKKIITIEEATFETIKLIGENGEQMGDFTMKKACEIAKNQKLDLMIVAEKDGVKIAKIVNYGKKLYQQKKNQKKAKENIVKTKEIKFGLNIGSNDYIIKMNKIIDFLNNKNKVKVCLVVNGREKEHFDMIKSFMEKVIIDLKEFGKTDDKIKLEGKNVILNFYSN